LFYKNRKWLIDHFNFSSKYLIGILVKEFFVEYDLHDEGAIVEFTDEDRYKDKIRMSTGLLCIKETI